MNHPEMFDGVFALESGSIGSGKVINGVMIIRQHVRITRSSDKRAAIRLQPCDVAQEGP